MPLIEYESHRFTRSTAWMVQQANKIIEEYSDKGFTLTLRQLYYQFVARDLLPNRDREYKRLGDVISNARLAGLVDWHAIEDRTRYLRALQTWEAPKNIVAAAAQQYRMDLWRGQKARPEVWIEKDALVGVIEGICQAHRVDYFSCRGYASQSSLWEAAQRIRGRLRIPQELTFTGMMRDNGRTRPQGTIIFHLGDHDPSGIDMTRDIRDRLRLFVGRGDEKIAKCILVERLALNMDQIEQYDPPPNPAKLTDSRAPSYVAQYGDDSWELDALEPEVITGLIDDAVRAIRNDALWDKALAEENDGEQKLARVAKRMK